MAGTEERIRRLRRAEKIYRAAEKAARDKLKRIAEKIKRIENEEEEGEIKCVSLYKGEDGDRAAEGRPAAKEKTKVCKYEDLYECAADEAEVKTFLAKNLGAVLKTLVDRVNSDEICKQQALVKNISAHISNRVRWVLLHDVSLYAQNPEVLVLLADGLLCTGFAGVPGHIGRAVQSVVIHHLGAEDGEGKGASRICALRKKFVPSGGDIAERNLKEAVERIVEEYRVYEVFKDYEIDPLVFDSAEAIRIYSNHLDWDWTYNHLIREVICTHLKKGSEYMVYLLGVLYLEWSRAIGPHASLESVLRILDRVVGLGRGEAIEQSEFTLNEQLASLVVLRQFRPGIAVRWQRKRIEEASAEEQERIRRIWRVQVY